MEIEAAGQRVQITHPEKVLFPGEGITKEELARYYLRAAPIMVPLVRDRPMTLQRYTGGIAEPGFYQKEAPSYLPPWIDTVRLRLHHHEGEQRQILCNGAATLVYLANQDAITQHVWLSRADRLENPDRLIFDLDPPDDNFQAIKDAAVLLKGELADLSMTAFLMTTGSRGLHVVVPLDRSADFEAARAWAKAFAEKLARAQPDRLTTAVRKETRGRRLFLDYLRNAYGQTGVAPYSARARPGAPVATPVTWTELPGLKSSQQYNIRNVLAKIDRDGDPWKDIEEFAAPLPPTEH